MAGLALAAALLAPSLAPSSVRAEFRWEGLSAMVTPAKPADEPTARQAPLTEALNQLVPSNWRIEFAGNVNPLQPVSWSRSAPWESAVRETLGTANLTGTFRNRELLVQAAGTLPSSPSPAAATTSPITLTPRTTPIPLQPAADVGPVPGPATAPAPVHVVPAPGPVALPAEPPPVSSAAGPSYWMATDGSTLEQTLKDWARIAGWKVHYQTSNTYPIDAGHEFTGSFEEAATTLSRSFARRTPAPVVDFWANRVITVTTPNDRKNEP